MGFFEKEGLRYFQFELFKGQKLFHAVLTRHGGFSQSPYHSLNFGGTVGDHPEAVLKNHKLVYEVLGLDYNSRLDVWQVHGSNILCGESPRKSDAPHQKADGILTDKSDLTLFMRFADCVPILLMDPVKKVIGIIHAGWQGTAKRIALTAVEKMCAQYGSKPENILAGIGPSICQDCYEVGSDVEKAFYAAFGEDAKQFFETRENKLYLDLWAANQKILETAGIKHIEVAGVCTACHLEDWYSHRAENGLTGRFGVIMRIEDD